MKNIWLPFLFILGMLACNRSNMKIEKKLPSNPSPTQVVSVPIVEKRFVKKNGEVTDQKEFYLQMSIQDYFIKFCESKVSEDDFRKAFAKETGFIKTLKLEVEFLNGEWDRCSEEEVQSRVGAYVIIHRILS